ncbi:hypothetical protein SDJN03_00407, partial [Cucurbita argyrosperma subsp. sororia]
MGITSNTMAATLLTPSMTILFIILLLNPPTISHAAINKTAAEWCDGRLENCLIGDLNSDSEFLMETETSRMLLDFNSFQTPNTNNPDKQSAPECNRPPRYDGCLGQKNIIPNPENCDTRNRVNPC